MITGDHLETAVAIARELNIIQPGDESLTGKQLEQMSDEDLRKVVNRVAVYARYLGTQAAYCGSAEVPWSCCGYDR